MESDAPPKFASIGPSLVAADVLAGAPNARDVEPAAPRQPMAEAPKVSSPTILQDATLKHVPPPLHVLPGIAGSQVQRGPGRPRRVRCAPTASEAAYTQRVREALGRHVDVDAVVVAADQQAGAPELLDALIAAVAREQAALAYRVWHEPGDQRALERARSRRIDGLVALARLVLERRKLEAESPAIPDRVRTRVIAAFMEELERAAIDVLGDETAGRLISGVRARLESPSGLVGAATARSEASPR